MTRRAGQPNQNDGGQIFGARRLSRVGVPVTS